MSLAAHIEGDGVALHAKLRRNIASLIPEKSGSIDAAMKDVLQAVALIEVLFTVKFATFSTDRDLMEINISDHFTFATCYSNKVATLMQQVILTVTIVSSNHVYNTVVNTKSGTGAYVKGIDKLPQWLIDTSSRHKNPVEGTVHAMIRDWKSS